MNKTKQRSTRSPHAATTRPLFGARIGAYVAAGTFTVATLLGASAHAQPQGRAPQHDDTRQQRAAAPVGMRGTWRMPGSASSNSASSNSASSNSAPNPATSAPPVNGYYPQYPQYPQGAQYPQYPQSARYPQYPQGAQYPQPAQYAPAQPTAGPGAGSNMNAPRMPDASHEDEPSAPWFDLALGTYVPLSMGGQGTLELPGRLLLQLDVGWMPPAYGSAINGLVQAVGGYNSSIGQIVNSALEDAIVVRVSGGWRPFPSAGFEIYGGYTSVSLSGSVSPATVAEVVGGEFAGQVASAVLVNDINVSSQLHNFHVALGWRWVAFDHLVIRTNVGYTQTVGSSTSIESPDAPAAVALASPVVEAEMGKVYEQYVKLPLVGLSGGYRF